MNNVYFPKDEDSLNFVLNVYASEVKDRADWIVRRYKNFDTDSMDVMTILKTSIDIIGDAIVIDRIINGTGARKNEREIVKERVRLIHDRWPGLNNLNLPENLGKVRNDYEHFDTRLDQWAKASERKIIIDNNMTPPGIFQNAKEKEVIRNYYDGVLYFWNKGVVLKDVVKWATDVSYEMFKSH
ncbi:hypothetical protein J18TS1_27570 [Oceanobacillus oncorhynchi subsp. incaldanensis]|uniref:hypothetical protein n=1 Tax=Oceanobacillus oncorhynchi TaxID=545501 RepID=UPI001B234D50|nr:hypothetical protein [Oceanobacillus oncorhynchi]GIO19657.1 hypothetical protein J18TS1_27570 [Oceanobacillus oncorhynchi subsp. incaldanensis]